MAENRANFAVRGIESEDERRRIRDELEDVEGVMEADVDAESGEVSVRFDFDLLSEEKVKSTVRELGYEIE